VPRETRQVSFLWQEVENNKRKIMKRKLEEEKVQVEKDPLSYS
jgi:hypothetical protein